MSMAVEPDPGEQSADEAWNAGETQRLARAAGAGDAARFGELYERLAPALYTWASLRIRPGVRGEVEPEDVVAEVWVRAWKAFAEFDAEAQPFRPWIFRIAKNVLLEAFRRIQRDRPAAGGAGPTTRLAALAEVPDSATNLSRRVARNDGVQAVLAWVQREFAGDERALFVHCGLEGLSYAEAALVEPLSVGIHAARLTDIQPGKTALVLGAGPIGLLATVAAHHAGALQVVVADVVPQRLELARRLGATTAVDVRTEDLGAVIDRLTGGAGADALLDTTGSRAVLEDAPNLVGRGGAIAVIGLPEDDAVTYRMNTVVDKELAIRGVFRYANTYRAGVALVASQRYPLEAVITHRLPLEETQRGFDLLLDHKDQAVKVMITL